MPDRRPIPPDQQERNRALEPANSVLVQAPAGSGKTDLLTRRFLRLLAEVEEPSHVVAITFTRAAAAEMQQRILSELEAAASSSLQPSAKDDPFSIQILAQRALNHSVRLGWKLLELPSQLRVTTIDAFCREIALQQPLLSGLGGALEILSRPDELYRRAARLTLFQLDEPAGELAAALRLLLLQRDNNLSDLENLLVEMLRDRDRWMHDFIVQRHPNWDALRIALEQPFAEATRGALQSLHALFGKVPGSHSEVLALARFACKSEKGDFCQPLAELPDFPAPPYFSAEDLEATHQAWLVVASLLLTKTGEFRKKMDATLGFPADCKAEKARLLALIHQLSAVPGLESALAGLSSLPPARYPDEEWAVVRASFILLRHAAAQLHIAFAESAHVDYTEVAQIARHLLLDPDREPTQAALALADNIHHLLVDEFQDTSRSQHRLLGSLLAAWPDNTGRSLFLVGDPMQSIYYFRGADAELFPQVRDRGLELPTGEDFPLQPVRLSANFRTDPAIVNDLNEVFSRVFAENDGSGITFAAAEPVREPGALPLPRRQIHCAFMPGSNACKSVLGRDQSRQLRANAQQAHTESMLAVIRAHMPLVDEARADGKPWRIAVLARAKKHLAPLALALRKAAIPFRAVELEDLTARPEILDALALARAILNPHDRVAWLGLLRAPWCALSLADLHQLAGDQDSPGQTIPDLLVERQSLLSPHGQSAVHRLHSALHQLPRFRAAQPLAALGTQIQHLWLHLGGPACVDATALDNLDLLWSCLDALPAGESDLLGPALDAALASLTAQPDAAASPNSGVQLMTIHKSKGLEFEVVLVPELQATNGARPNRRLLSWIERGLAAPTPEGEITEFLIAPLHAKGAQSGSARSFVERISRERESQESRRLLYVAATRAREELHFFARPEFRIAAGSLELLDPRISLLATSWPALEEEVQSQFAEWQTSAQAAQILNAAQSLTAVAASQSATAATSAPPRPALLRRLPADFVPAAFTAGGDSAAGSTPIAADAPLYDRHEGGPLVRALGVAVHALFQDLAQLHSSLQLPAALNALRALQPRVVAQARAAGLTLAQAGATAAEAFALVSRAAADPLAQWILAPHPDAEAEASWTGLLAEKLRTVRVDRVFRAGPAPLASGDQFWWIIDYKTAHANRLNPAQALPELRAQFAPQLETYAAVLRLLHGPHVQLRAALYYPRLLQFDWWEIS